MIALQRKPTHPGEILREDFLKEYHLTTQQFAHRLRLSRSTVQKILRGQGRITPNIALRLAQCFGTSPEVWLGLQNEWDLYRERRANDHALREIIPMAASM